MSALGGRDLLTCYDSGWGSESRSCGFCMLAATWRIPERQGVDQLKSEPSRAAPTGSGGQAGRLLPGRRPSVLLGLRLSPGGLLGGGGPGRPSPSACHPEAGRSWESQLPEVTPGGQACPGNAEAEVGAQTWPCPTAPCTPALTRSTRWGPGCTGTVAPGQ